MRASTTLKLMDMITSIEAEESISHVKYRAAKPCRLYFKYNNCAIQLFPKGCIQILGNVTDNEVHTIHTYLSQLLHPIRISKPRTKSSTVLCHWSKPGGHLYKIPSNKHISNDMELFPGTLVHMPRRLQQCKVKNYHCALFYNGTAIVTGVTNIQEAERVLRQCIDKYIIPHL